MSKCKVSCYAKPYEGDQPFAFFSYCHEDESACYPIIERLAAEGCRIWYDDGINPGEDWLDVIAEHISRSVCVIAAISENSAQSHNCKRERAWAMRNNVPFIPVVLEKFHMSGGLRFQLGSTNFVEKAKIKNDEDFYSKILSSAVLKQCLGIKTADYSHKINAWKKHCEEYSGKPAQVVTTVDYKAELDKIDGELQNMLDRTVVASVSFLTKEISQAEALLRKVTEIKQTLENDTAFVSQRSELLTAFANLETDIRSFLNSLDSETPRLEQFRKTVLFVLEKKQKLIRDYEYAGDVTLVSGYEETVAAKLQSICSEMNKYCGEVSKLGKDNLAGWNKHQDKAAELIEQLRSAEKEIADLSEQIQKEIDELLNVTVAILVRVKNGEYYSIGKHKTVIGSESVCNIVIANSGIAAKQLQISANSDGVFVQKIDGCGSVIFNGTELTASQKADGINLLLMGNEQWILAAGKSADTLIADKQLTLLTAVETSQMRLLTEEPVLLDREHSVMGTKCEWNAPVLADKFVHRKAHAKLFLKDGKWYLAHTNIMPEGLRDNPTYLNDKELQMPYGEDNGLFVNSGDIIRVHTHEFRFEQIALKEIKA